MDVAVYRFTSQTRLQFDARIRAYYDDGSIVDKVPLISWGWLTEEDALPSVCMAMNITTAQKALIESSFPDSTFTTVDKPTEAQLEAVGVTNRRLAPDTEGFLCEYIDVDGIDEGDDSVREYREKYVSIYEEVE